MNRFLNHTNDQWNEIVVIGLLGVDLLAIFFYLGSRVDLLRPVSMYLGLMAVAFCFYAYAGRRVLLRHRQNNSHLLALILIFGILFRLVLIAAPPSISTDIYRYVWDGRLTCHWINPYRWSPWDPRLNSLRDTTIWAHMEYKAYQTVYMPTSQLIFAISYVLFRNNISGFKAVFTLFDIGIMLLIAAILKRIGKDPTRVIWYAWCPLPITEVSLAGHQDVIGVFFLMLTGYMLTLQKHRAAAFSLAAAGLTKGFALLLLPMFVRRWGKQLTSIMVLTLLYLGLPLWVYLPDFLHGMQQYLGYVHVNSGLFNLIDRLISLVTGNHFAITSKLSDAAILAAVGWSVWTKPSGYEEITRRAIIVLAVCLLVVPSLFPWYIVWLLPLVTIYGKDRPSTAFLALTALVNLVYLYYVSHMVYWWVTVVEYTPVYALLMWEWRRGYWRPASLDAPASAGGVSAIESVVGGADAETVSEASRTGVA